MAASDDGGLNWFQDLRTLSPPFVPLDPGTEWFIERTLQQARKSLADPNTVTVLVTGRAAIFADRVTHIARSAGLNFHEFCTSISGTYHPCHRSSDLTF